MSEPYRDLQTGVLVNKLGIMSATDLARAEYNITNLRIAELTVTPVAGTFDLDHLKAIHKHLFSDVYEWAGQTRTMNVVKPDPEDPRWVSTFAPAKTIHDVATSIREGLAEWKNLKELNQKDFTTLLATTYVTLNDMHPFPEGNGRSTQTLLVQLADEANYTVDYAKVRPDEWNRAASRSTPQRQADDPTVTRKGDPTLIQDVFRRIVEPLKERVSPHDRDR
ncbi:MAG: Fic family protein [Nitrospira sp.]|nr:Fic family protein [Nitrospira sp.]